jgi:cytochrome c
MNRQRLTVAAVASAIAALTGGALLLGGSAQAQDSIDQVFQKKCLTCHGPNADAKIAGPTLKGVAGRKIASVKGYAYSDALKAKGGTWTDANLDAYLTKPKDFVPGTKMIPSVGDPAQRKAIIAHLKTMK